MAIAGMTVARSLEPVSEADFESYNQRKANPLGDPINDNGGVTWFGSQFTGPGNRLLTGDHRYAASALPRSDNDWVTLEHDVDYYNAKSFDKNAIWDLDRKAIINSLKTTDPYGGNVATAVGLVVKNIVERTDEAVTGDNHAIYPRGEPNDYHIPWFDRHLGISRRVLNGKYDV